MAKRVGGQIEIKSDSVRYQAKGSFTYNLGVRKKTAVNGADGVHGYMDETVTPFIEGTITDSAELDVKNLISQKCVTVTIVLANGKSVGLTEAWFAGDADQTTEEGEIPVRWEGIDAEELTV